MSQQQIDSASLGVLRPYPLEDASIIVCLLLFLLAEANRERDEAYSKQRDAEAARDFYRDFAGQPWKKGDE
jgi:hypothetical protein